MCVCLCAPLQVIKQICNALVRYTSLQANPSKSSFNPKGTLIFNIHGSTDPERHFDRLFSEICEQMVGPKLAKPILSKSKPIPGFT